MNEEYVKNNSISVLPQQVSANAMFAIVKKVNKKNNSSGHVRIKSARFSSPCTPISEVG